MSSVKIIQDKNRFGKNQVEQNLLDMLIKKGDVRLSAYIERTLNIILMR